MTEVTEIALLHLRKDVDLEDDSSVALQTWRKAIGIVSSRLGFKDQFWGLRLEDKTQLVWTLDWDSVDKHKEFINHEDYKPFVAELAQVFDFDAHPPFLTHIAFTSADSLKAARSAPAALDNGSSGVAMGWYLEDDVESSEGKKVTALQALLGWESVEQHMALRNKPEFAEVVKPVRAIQAKGRDDMGMFHAKLRK
ncbi:uncharacterized protein AB675_5203 [Cyphellophora attinorum]|uniref:ABM domain-containing protein n=1 Tax=Cyphellophora attinorum TaxID=1664694 RepID=A0A0N0NLN5_9EURO|nr:uncharacterized protein AB675_5203 [Phialophora attinorum]KPI39511.1 hypothetical protein AB675_5203 [Phialophora attinorum]